MRKRSQHTSHRYFHHLHNAGPGSYNLPPLIGQLAADSNKINNPRYSIGKAKKMEIKVMDKNLSVANIGKHSPGVGRYSPDPNKQK